MDNEDNGRNGYGSAHVAVVHHRLAADCQKAAIADSCKFCQQLQFCFTVVSYRSVLQFSVTIPLYGSQLQFPVTFDTVGLIQLV